MAHFAIGATYGPTDPTRAMLPFILAATALKDGDTVTLMLFHDAVHMAVRDVAKDVVPFGPPQRYEQVVSHENATVYVCKPCAASRRISEDMLNERTQFAGMDVFHAAAKREDARSITF